ncbi:MAG: PepSY-associated TM helix domain-containing protein [Lacunisphaera sp.]|nr:PepSY-associated TM helix domain-containing protein [Lacunisphaera sp.]
MTVRQVFFWLHLVAGLIAGVSIGIMCFTGTALAFEPEIVGWAERDARRVVPPADLSARLPLETLQRKLREAQPEFRPAGVTLQNDPAAAVVFSAGRDGGFYVNPYSGEVRQPASTKMRDFMQVMTDWHRYLALAGDHRPLGKLINGICNLAFCALALTGLYLWWPRSFTWRSVQAVALLNWRLGGKARDFNWHNVIGLWSAPILIVLTLTAVPISFRWGGNMIYQLTGEEAPAQAGPAAASAVPAVEIKRPTPDARPLSYDAIVARAQQDFPRWETLSLHSGGQQRGQRLGPAAQTGAAATPPREGDASAPIQNRDSKIENSTARAAPQPLTFTIREAGSWPRTATTTLTLNPYTGETLSRTGYADLSAARGIRSWTRFLHTGQALGWGGQLAAGLACLGGCFLIYTGFALSWRRFFSRPAKLPPNGTMPL